jgi:uncharacterized protein YodC (DUF2158 family)
MDVGDVVKLPIAGPALLVVKAGGDDEILCGWFDAELKWRTEAFPVAALEVIKDAHAGAPPEHAGTGLFGIPPD